MATACASVRGSSKIGALATFTSLGVGSVCVGNDIVGFLAEVVLPLGVDDFINLFVGVVLIKIGAAPRDHCQDNGSYSANRKYRLTFVHHLYLAQIGLPRPGLYISSLYKK